MSYDVAKAENSIRSKVYRMVFGYSVENGQKGRYRYPGYLDHPGSQYVGQSVLLLRPEVASRFTRRLTELGVTFSARAVYIVEP